MTRDQQWVVLFLSSFPGPFFSSDHPALLPSLSPLAPLAQLISP